MSPKKRKKQEPERTNGPEIALPKETIDELRAIRVMDIGSYWHACAQVAQEYGVLARDISAAVHYGTREYFAMWGPEGRPRDD